MKNRKNNFKKEEIVALGFNEMGDLSGLNTLEDIKEKCREIYPDKNERSIGTISHMIYKFLNDFKKKTSIHCFT